MCCGLAVQAQNEIVTVPEVDYDHVEQTDFKDNWFISGFVGVQQSTGSFLSQTSYGKRLNPVGAIAVGKNITPINEIRLMVDMERNSGQWDGLDKFNYKSAGVSAEWMVNFVNWIAGYRENRVFGLKSIIGVRGLYSWDYPENPDVTNYKDGNKAVVGLKAGLEASWRLNTKWSIDVDAAYTLFSNTFDGQDQDVPNVSNRADGQLQLMVGATYHFRNKTNKIRQFANVHYDQSTVNNVNETLKNLRDRTNYLKENPNKEYKKIEVDQKVIYTLIAFAPQQSYVDTLQQTNVYNTSKVWAEHKDAPIYICNAAAEDTELFQNRAKAIKQILTTRWSVPSNKIKVVSDESKIKKAVEKSDYKIIFIVNE